MHAGNGQGWRPGSQSGDMQGRRVAENESLRDGGAQCRQWQGNVAIELYKDGKPKADAVVPGNALPAGFVAPPRTIADITAILDSEKPHPATLAKLKASADNEPGKNISQADLAEFYIERGTARSALGRNMEALADGEKALAAALASGDGYFGQRIRQFITLQKLTLGD